MLPVAKRRPLEVMEPTTHYLLITVPHSTEDRYYLGSLVVRGLVLSTTSSSTTEYHRGEGY